MPVARCDYHRYPLSGSEKSTIIPDRLFIELNQRSLCLSEVESKLGDYLSRLRDMVHKTEQDPAARMAELERQKAVIEKKIETIRQDSIAP
jgi:hypothetical protein